ncbi:GspE/PulE family protein [Rhizobium leguminosarum]|uniref:GspE/PulE family protein n=1 Tax=Rhizobium leguminosarum TaxID=384 RepID=UPI002E15D147|nr:ATPase, T2SS/T4P/T4SS family [Rhizobium leguminosarum]
MTTEDKIPEKASAKKSLARRPGTKVRRQKGVESFDPMRVEPLSPSSDEVSAILETTAPEAAFDLDDEALTAALDEAALFAAIDEAESGAVEIVVRSETAPTVECEETAPELVLEPAGTAPAVELETVGGSQSVAEPLVADHVGTGDASSDVVAVEADRPATEEAVAPAYEEKPAARARKFGHVSAFRAYQTRLRAHNLGRNLLDKKKISEQTLFAAVKEQEVTGDRIGEILVRNQYLTNQDRVQAILEESPSRIAQEKVSKTRIPVELLEKHRIIVSTIHEDGIFVGTMGDERIVRRIVEHHYPDKTLTFVPYVASAFQPFLANMRKSADMDGAITSQENLLDRLVYKALAMGASDIHFLPRPKSYSVRFRANRIMMLEYEGTAEEFNKIVAQAKNRARLDTSKKHLPQDGSFQLEFNRKMIDLRVNTTPNIEGESMVIRVQDPERVNPHIQNLGITRLDSWVKGVTREGGLCLVCGKVNTGKTTTLNATTRYFDRHAMKIVEIADPIEQRIADVSQISINESIGYTFNKALEAQLRQDPNVVILGEVRDDETARTMMRAAATGIMVIATLHTGSILESVNRLIGLGVKDHELKYVLRAVMAQNLIRKVCTSCHGTGRASDGFACHDCGGEGYAGSTLVSECEYFHDHEEVDRLLSMRTDASVARSWPTIVEDAVGKYRQGVTDLLELDRVFGAEVRPYLEAEVS